MLYVDSIIRERPIFEALLLWAIRDDIIIEVMMITLLSRLMRLIEEEIEKQSENIDPLKMLVENISLNAN
ncbi:hypothetical protein B9T19_01285 [Ignatzschineria sp. F8392]|nr:hypothetical protein B9T19_01285 [Ignatzschineria sp. F8392]